MNSGDRWLLIVIFAFRLAVILLPNTILQSDPDAYLRLAKELATTGVYGSVDPQGIPQPTAFRPPLYPAVLAATILLTGAPSVWLIGAVHAALATISAALLLKIGRSLKIKYTFLAVLLFSLDPLLIRQSQLIMTETIATTMAVITWWLCSLRFDESNQHLAAKPDQPKTTYSVTLQLLMGIAFGLATLTRPTAIVWLLMIIIHHIIQPRVNRSHMFKQAAWLWIGFMLVMSPWMMRNRHYFGRPIWATTHGGYTLLLANNPILYEHFRSGSVSRDWDEDLFHDLWARHNIADPHEPEFWEPSSLNNPTASDANISPSWLSTTRHPEIAQDQLAQQVAIQTIRQSPGMFLWSSLVRIGWLWTPLPNPRPDSILKWPITLWYIGLYLLAISGALRVGRSNLNWPWLAGWLLIASLTLVHALYWSNMRMRAPAMPVIYLLAGAAMTQIPTRSRPDHEPPA